MLGRDVGCLIIAVESPGYFSFLTYSKITRLELNFQYGGDKGMHSVRCNHSKLRKEMKEVKSHRTAEESEANSMYNIYKYIYIQPVFQVCYDEAICFSAASYSLVTALNT